MMIDAKMQAKHLAFYNMTIDHHSARHGIIKWFINYQLQLIVFWIVVEFHWTLSFLFNVVYLCGLEFFARQQKHHHHRITFMKSTVDWIIQQWKCYFKLIGCFYFIFLLGFRYSTIDGASREKHFNFCNPQTLTENVMLIWSHRKSWKHNITP